jgi:hypothetical protein
MSTQAIKGVLYFETEKNRILNPNLENAGHLFKQDYRFHGSDHKPRIGVLESHLLLPRNGDEPADRTSERAHGAASPAAFRPRASTAPICRHVPPRLSSLSSAFPPLPPVSLPSSLITSELSWPHTPRVKTSSAPDSSTP